MKDKHTNEEPKKEADANGRAMPKEEVAKRAREEGGIWDLVAKSGLPVLGYSGDDD